MFHGFYNLASGMITQSKNLNVISNNMANVSTPGYKSDTLATTTFQQEMLYRTGNQNRSSSVPIGTTNMIRIPEQTITDFSIGNYVETGNSLDFAIQGDGFFKIENAEGEMSYTRNGSFYIDDDNCLALKGSGKVMGTGGEIFLETDRISVDSAGGIYDETGELVDNIEIVDFEDKAAMTKQANGLFTSGGIEQEVENPNLVNKMLEQSNVTAIKSMQDMMASQRSLQSASQLLKMYDQIMNKASTEMARM